MPTPQRLLPLLVLLLAGCASTDKPEPISLEDYSPRQMPEPAPIGKFLADLDKSMRAWTSLTLAATTAEGRRKARQLEAVLAVETTKRIDELIYELESGPPRNRQRAAPALGFTRDPRAQSPLLAALHDSDPNVVHNALLGLAILGLPDTPTEDLLEQLAENGDPDTRSQAAYALRSIIEAGAPAESLVYEARLALLDPAPGVRSQMALVLGLAGDSDSVQALADLLHDDVALVKNAAMEALVMVAQEDAHAKGDVARALVDAWVDADKVFKPRLHVAMTVLAIVHVGDEEEDWIEWSRRLP